MQQNTGINGLITGILYLQVLMLYSVNLQIMQHPNTSVLGMPTLLSILKVENWLVPLVIINCLPYLQL